MILIDSRVGDRVDIISRDGSSLASINDKGGRYEDLIDATFSTIDSLIIIDSQEELLYYNLQGEFVKSAKAPWGEYIEAIGDKLVRQTKRSHLCSNQVNELISLSTEEITLRKGIASEAISRLSEIVKGRITARNSNDELLIKPSYCDTIYALCSDSTFYVKYVTNFGEDSFWQEYATTIEDSITSKIFNSHYKYTTDLFYESNNLLYLKYRYYSFEHDVLGSVECVYNKTDKQLYNMNYMHQLIPMVVDPAPRWAYGDIVGVEGDNLIFFIPSNNIETITYHIKQNPDIPRRIIDPDFFLKALKLEEHKRPESMGVGMLLECTYKPANIK